MFFRKSPTLPTLLGLVILLSLMSIKAYSQKTDTLFHINGNILKGEIKKYDLGIITFKMDGMGTISVNAEKISGLRSKKFFEIIFKSGNLYYGSFDTVNIEGKVKIIGVDDTSIVSLVNIVSFFPIKTGFFARTNGRFDLGFDYNKASNVFRLSYGGILAYRAQKIYSEFTWDGYRTSQDLDSTKKVTDKVDINLNAQLLIKNGWYYAAQAGLNRNTELGLDSRIYLALSILNDFIHTNRNRFYGGVALSPNRESSSESSTFNLEAVALLNYAYYKHTTPEIHINTDTSFFPSLTDWGRYRFNYNLKAMIEVIRNFDVGVKGYYTFDSKPASENASNFDWGATLSFGYSFN